MSSSKSTLDDVLREIQDEGNNNAQLAASPALQSAAVLQLLGTIQKSTEHHVSTSSSLIGQSGLSAHQRTLPVLPLGRIVGSLVAMLVLVAGAGATTMLTQQSQDVRNQAYDGKLSQTVLQNSPSATPMQYFVSEQETVKPESEAVGEKRTLLQNPRMLIGGFLIAISLVLLVGMVLWFFAV